ncbi:MAG: YggT family protein [Lentisphaerae bacterium]|nr:YggT family protein [Lentisphaerota bacterium]
MVFSTWDSLFNLLLLIFWIRVWTRDERETIFNPYLAASNRLTGAVLHFLRPAFFMMPERLVSLIAMLFILALRAFVAPRAESGWVLHLGFEWRQAHEAGLTTFLTFTVISFAIFIFKIWGVSLLFLRDDSRTVLSHTYGALQAVSRPFVQVPYPLRPAILLVCGICLTIVLNLVGYPTRLNPYLPPDALAGAVPGLNATLVWRALISALSGWVEVFSAMIQTLVILILGSWIAMFTGSPSISHACRDWTDLLMGPMRRYPVRIGAFDLSPVVYIFILGAIQSLLQGILLQSYIRLLNPT